jgi:hypothetical protein
MYDLAGFKNEAEPEHEETGGDTVHNLIEKTLSRYNCTKVIPS